MQVTQKVNVHTFMSSELKKLNSKLHNIIIEHSNNEDMGAMMTSWYHDDKNFHEIDGSKEVDEITKEIEGFLNSLSH